MTESLPPIQAKAIAHIMARQPRTPAASRPDPHDADSEPHPSTAADDELADPDLATEDSPGDPE